MLVRPFLRESCLGLSLVFLLCISSHAQEIGPKILQSKHYHPELTTAHTISVQASATVQHQAVNADSLLHIIRSRMEKVGYEVATQSAKNHNVTIKVRCEEPTLSTNSNEPHQPMLAPPVVPPCTLQYFFQEVPQEWQRIDRIIYNAGVSAAQRAAITFSGSHNALPFSSQFLKEFEFPLLLSAEWNQIGRLFTILKAEGTLLSRKQYILQLFGETQAQEAFPFLIHALDDPELQVSAAQALGHFGKKAQPHLIPVLKTHRSIQMQAAAAKSLGQIGAATGDTSLTPLYLEIIHSPGRDTTVIIECVWALGKSPDFQAHPTLEKLERQIWNTRSHDPMLQQLREAVDWSIREVRQGGHTGDYD